MIDTLCFSGGGVKGISFLGALKYLKENEMFKPEEIKTLVGTSVGAILALLLAVDYSIEELIDFVLKFDFSKFKLETDSTKLLLNFGIDSGDKFVILLNTLLKEKLGVEDLTFMELYNKTNKNLKILATNYTLSKSEVFNYETTPDTDVILATRMSFSVPFLFTPIEYKNCYYIDGGVSCNFGLFCCNNKTTLGFAIDLAKENNELNSLFVFLQNMCKISINCNSLNFDSYLGVEEKYQILKIQCRQEDAFEFTIKTEQIKRLIEDGSESSKKYYSNFVINDIMKNLINKISSSVTEK